MSKRKPVDRPVEVEVEETPIPEIKEIKTGIVVDCDKLNVREEPRSDADIICTIEKNSEVMIDEYESTNNFYRVFTASGIEGFCMKKYISVQK